MDSEAAVSGYQITLQIAPAYADHIREEWLISLIAQTLEAEGEPSGAEISVVIVDDKEIRRLNKTYRDTDRVTDVLAFSAREGQGFVAPEEARSYLGDVIVSYPRAVVQASEQRHPVEDELALLVIHGCLHLMGYTDEQDPERERMWARQQEILAGLAP